ncbi:MAG: HNH endonuclease [Anaerolineae bacterium]|nr:HNH endonuclease [Anaerolineae bacterium]
MSVTKEQKQHIRALAGYCCEYCRVAEEDRLSRLQIDHIVPVKHGGKDNTENLCLACLKCNSYKGSNVAALDPHTDDATKLYNPRHQIWAEHFAVNLDGTLTGISPEGRVTILVLRINEDSRVRHRRMAMRLGEYPCQQQQ